MDDIVKQAMAKWPNVPHCYGWLGLDARGNWYLRDDQAQAQGSFASGAEGAKGAKGWLLDHEKLIGFIERNYESDAAGRWFFQNGPQRVYVELEAAPWIWRVQADHTVLSHTGRPAEVRVALIDDAGRVFLATDLGLGLVHTQDMLLLADAVEQGLWVPEPVQAAELPARFGYVMSPAAEPSH
ncbi:MAG: DUF2946 family protein [Ottowia sp.]|uniref:DUF2946 family protein n=1 Tax=unclassified Ottowia TaxID=2645081 RepID=UPI003C2C549C